MSDTVTMSLTDFLLARIADDEAVAREPWPHVLADVQAWWDSSEDEPGFYASDQPDDVKGLAKTLEQIEQARGTYARVLAQCAAYRAIVEGIGWHQMYGDETPASGDLCDATLRHLAAIWADHPDYDPAWAVTT